MKSILALGDNGGGKKGSADGARILASYLGAKNQSTLEGFQFNYSEKHENSWKKSQLFLACLANKTNHSLIFHKKIMVFSGDHSSAIGTLGGVRLRFPNEKIGVLWIDAHADSHTPQTSPSGNLHGMPVAALLGQGKSLHGPWKNFLKIANPPENEGSCYTPDNFLFLGLNSYESEELDFFSKEKIQHYTSENINRNPEASLSAVDLFVASHDLIFVTFDVDALDSSVFMSTGLPNLRGIFPEYISNVLSRVVDSSKFLGLEISEFNPNRSTLARDLETVQIALKPVLQKNHWTPIRGATKPELANQLSGIDLSLLMPLF